MMCDFKMEVYIMKREECERELIELFSEIDDKTKQGLLMLLENIDFFNKWIKDSKLEDQDLTWIKDQGLLSDDTFIKILSAYIISYSKNIK